MGGGGGGKERQGRRKKEVNHTYSLSHSLLLFSPPERETSTEEVDKSRKASTSHALSGLMAYSSSGSEDNDEDDS